MSSDRSAFQSQRGEPLDGRQCFHVAEVLFSTTELLITQKPWNNENVFAIKSYDVKIQRSLGRRPPPTFSSSAA